MNKEILTHKELLTHSARQSFKRCRRKYWYEYELGLRPETEARYFRFGNAIHGAIEEWENNDKCDESALNWLSQNANLNSFDYYAACALMAGYFAKYRDCTLLAETYVCEPTFCLPLRPSEPILPGNEAHGVFDNAGKIDGIGRTHSGQIAVVERKTVQGSIDTDAYWRYLHVDSQISDYCNAARDLGYDVEVVVYDVIRKPGSSPLKATPIEKRKYKKKDGELYANQREHDETPEEYYARIKADVFENLDTYFQRREVPRLEQGLDESRNEAYDVACDIEQARVSGRWYKNTSRINCPPCAFFSFCAGLGESDDELADGLASGIVPPGFVRLENVHPELGDCISVSDSEGTNNDK